MKEKKVLVAGFTEKGCEADLQRTRAKYESKGYTFLRFAEGID